MVGILFGSVLAFGAVFALTGMFENPDDDDDTPPDPQNPPNPQAPPVTGTLGDDSLTADDGRVEGWGGADTLTLSGDADGTGNQGNDTIRADDSSTGHGARGNDILIANGSATVWGDDGLDRIEMYSPTVASTAVVTGYGGAGSDFLSAFGGKAYGGDGDDLIRGEGFLDFPVYDGLGASLYGGAGDDVLLGFTDAQMFGGIGDDTLDLANGSDGSGGAGDDLLILSPTAFDNVPDNGTVIATGGSGPDIFALEMTPPNMFQSIAPTVITDYTPGEDRLLVEATVAGDYIFDRATFTENADPGDTEITLHWRAVADGADGLSSVVQLQGVQDFDPADLEVTSFVANAFSDPAATPAVGGLLSEISGTPTADAFSNQRNALLITGDGADSVMTAKYDDLIVDLGAGDDTFRAFGAAHVAFGGAGDDTYVMNARDDAPGGTLATFFDGGAGADTITIRADGSNPDALFSFDGGAGADRLEAFAATGKLTLAGGDGADILIGRAGQTLTDSGTATERNDLTLNLTAAEVTAQGPAQIRMSGFDELTLNIDASLTGAVTFAYETADDGAEVLFTEIRVGGQLVAIVEEGIPLRSDAIGPNDPRLTVTRT